MSLSKTEKKKLCAGCRANRYNMGRGFQESSIDTAVTCDECWHLKSAKLCNKEVYYSPGDYKPTRRTRTLDCWHNNMGYGKIVK